MSLRRHIFKYGGGLGDHGISHTKGPSWNGRMELFRAENRPSIEHVGRQGSTPDGREGRPDGTHLAPDGKTVLATPEFEGKIPSGMASGPDGTSRGPDGMTYAPSGISLLVSYELKVHSHRPA